MFRVGVREDNELSPIYRNPGIETGRKNEKHNNLVARLSAQLSYTITHEKLSYYAKSKKKTQKNPHEDLKVFKMHQHLSQMRPSIQLLSNVVAAD